MMWLVSAELCKGGQLWYAASLCDYNLQTESFDLTVLVWLCCSTLAIATWSTSTLLENRMWTIRYPSTTDTFTIPDIPMYTSTHTAGHMNPYTPTHTLYTHSVHTHKPRVSSLGVCVCVCLCVRHPFPSSVPVDCQFLIFGASCYFQVEYVQQSCLFFILENLSFSRLENSEIRKDDLEGRDRKPPGSIYSNVDTFPHWQYNARYI